MENKENISPSSTRNPWFWGLKYLAFSLIPCIALLIAGEVFLRFSNFRYSDTPLLMLSKPETIANSSFTKRKINLIKDKYQLWVSLPTFEQRYGAEKNKPPKVKRIITLGCSCTQACAYTTRSYPDHMEEILNAKFPFGFRVINAGEGSYTSFQGLQRLKREIVSYEPDILTVFFGWNDHWAAMTPDHLVKVKANWQIDLINFLEKFRVYQAYHWLIAQIKAKILKKERQEIRGNYRVPPEKYEKNLNDIINICLSNKIQPVLITAPFDAAQIRSSQNFPFSREALLETHHTYNEIVRKVGMARGVVVIDLEVFFLQVEPQRLSLYFSDGIHFTPRGCKLVAELIVQRMQELSVIQNPFQ
ncbi:MAG TPA: GDSL-type esterase/lipase family protein [Candidatus Omnitrophota bacterium]|nr:GDSL-type esterase/lipase family protein [Candidatus Omnitrophota bacterium]